jgi:hypothetical protein
MFFSERGFLSGRRWTAFVLSVSLLSASACDSFVEPRSATPEDLRSVVAHPAPPVPPKTVSTTPLYPAPVLYILYREYLHKNPGLTTLSPEDKHYQQYLERRLRQLYPTKGYSGMMKDAVEEMRQNRRAWLAYEQAHDIWIQNISPECADGALYDPRTGQPCPGVDGVDPNVDPSWDGQVEHAVPPDEMIPTLQMEIDTLQMTQPEIDHLYYQESLADGSFFQKRDEQYVVLGTGGRATLDDLIRAAGGGWTPPSTVSSGGEVVVQVNPALIATVVLSAGIIGWKVYRIGQAADRATSKSQQYFGPLNEQSTKRDAHRHIFLNMQMRRHVGSDLAKWIADRHEEQGGNVASDLTMDLHNNFIGREIRYKNFRGHWLWDRWDWNEWAVKVRDYINTSSNAEYIPEWKNATPTLEQARSRASAVPNWKYIYFAP